MITFWLLGTFMAALAVLAVLLPLLRQRAAAADEAEARLAVYRERYTELDREHDRGHLDEDQLAEAREELERELLAGLPSTPATLQGERGAMGRMSALAVALLVPALGLALYLTSGQPTLIGRDAVQGLSSADVERFREMAPQQRIRHLEPVVERQPGATRALTLLAQAYRATGRYGDAVDAYARVRAQGTEDPWLLARQAEALLLANGRRFTGSVEGLIQRSLAMDDANPLALMLAGHAALTRGDNGVAAEHWRRLRASLPNDSDSRAMIERLIARAETDSAADDAPQRAATDSGAMTTADAPTDPSDEPAEGGPRLNVRVSLDPHLEDAAPAGTPVFVFAHAAEGGGGPPLAVTRTTLGALPADLTLSDAEAMTPAQKLSQARKVVVTARAAVNGDVMAQSGDLEGRSGAVSVIGETPLDVRIDRRIE